MSRRLFLIKVVHTAIFIFMSSCIVYILLSGIIRNYHWTVFLAIGVVLAEGLVLIFNHWECPLTNLARKYGDEKGSVTDMFYPKWFVPHVFRFSTALFVIGLVLLAVNYLIR
ncbi:MAG TPA: hypothetical protein G4O01_06325 [Dehalococcoidia bacterium]|nr:hypothetical protein [Dehalococcoidia bacterium]